MSILVQLLIFVIVIALVLAILKVIPLDEPWKKIAYYIVLAIGLIYLIKVLFAFVPVM